MARTKKRSRSRSKTRTKSKKSYPTGAKAKEKIKEVMHEFKIHTLKTHDRPVTSRKRAIAIALSSARNA